MGWNLPTKLEYQSEQGSLSFDTDGGRIRITAIDEWNENLITFSMVRSELRPLIDWLEDNEEEW